MSEVLYKLFFHLFAIITRNTHAHLCLMPVRRLCAARHMRGNLVGNLYLVGHVHATSLHVEGGKPSCACGTGWAVSV